MRELGLAAGKRRFERALDRVRRRSRRRRPAWRRQVVRTGCRESSPSAGAWRRTAAESHRQHGGHDIPDGPGLLSILRVHAQLQFGGDQSPAAAGGRSLAKADRGRHCGRSTGGGRVRIGVAAIARDRRSVHGADPEKPAREGLGARIGARLRWINVRCSSGRQMSARCGEPARAVEEWGRERDVSPAGALGLGP